MSTDMQNPLKLVDILLIDDDPADVELTIRALKKGDAFRSLNGVSDGVEAMKYLRGEGIYREKPRPNLILLDLNMPRMDGRETLRAIKADETTRSIPVIVLTTSDSEKDVAESYDLQASCYLTKSVDLEHFSDAVTGVKEFWLKFVQYPSDSQ